MKRSIRLAKPHFFGEELEEVKSVLKSGWWSQGEKVAELEDGFAKFVGTRYAVATSSCTTALHIGIQVSLAYGVSVPGFTYPSAKYAALFQRRSYHEVDVNVETYNVESMRREGCLVPTHLFGNPCEMANVKGRFIVEDAASGVGSYYKGRHVGTMGDIGCFSLHSRKLLSTGEGGILTTDRELLDTQARMYRKDQGFKMSDITATIGLIQLRHLPEILEKRRRQAEVYTKLIRELEVPVKPQKTIQGAVHSYQAYVVALPKRSKEVIREMAEAGIETQVGTFGDSDLPNSRFLYERTLTLPLHHELSDEEQVFVIESLKKCLCE